jgi:hypothetical protein
MNILWLVGDAFVSVEVSTVGVSSITGEMLGSTEARCGRVVPSTALLLLVTVID